MAYVGPGAGFAVASSFLALFLGFLYSALALVTWPFRQLRRLLRSRRALGRAQVRRLVILGLDGLDPRLASRWMDEGELPNLARLRNHGTFQKLQTTTPPISPVAWSSFQTGVNPGKHAIFDFLARDRATYLPRLSSAEIRGPGRRLRLGPWAIPLGSAKARGMRKARPFWCYLGDAGVFSSVLRVPITFPPEKFNGVLLSGMCVPDLLGTQGTFSFYSTAPRPGEDSRGGVWFGLQRDGRNSEWFRALLPGPPGGKAGEPAGTGVPFRVRPRGPDGAEIRIQGRRFPIRLRAHSDWVQVRFGPRLRAAHGICKFYLKQVSPELELYVSPVNIDPSKPSLPISHPFMYAVYLARLLGPFATLGLAEDTWALNEGALDEDGFLEQCYQNHAERERMFFDALDKTRGGACICVFDTPDRVQHMFWRFHEPGHPAAACHPDPARYATVIADLYRRMDDLVARTLAALGDQDLLLVISDHGFASFQRCLNLNAWLHQNGYLALKDGCDGSGEWLRDVDWSRTRAFALGLGGIYLNQAGRERHGIVKPGRESEALKAELRDKLQALVDPSGGRAAVRQVIDGSKQYSGPYRNDGPDLVVGCHAGYRAGWDSVTGRVKGEVFEDNRKAWSGDHCVHPDDVPGVLFSNRRLECGRPAIVDIAATALDLFGVPVPRHFDGRPWRMAPQRPAGTEPAG
jgi:predicted AlkP superfamily phosphohydrolase/phosphomutase